MGYIVSWGDGRTAAVASDGEVERTNSGQATKELKAALGLPVLIHMTSFIAERETIVEGARVIKEGDPGFVYAALTTLPNHTITYEPEDEADVIAATTSTPEDIEAAGLVPSD